MAVLSNITEIKRISDELKNAKDAAEAALTSHIIILQATANYCSKLQCISPQTTATS